MNIERILFLFKRGIIPALILVVALDLRTAGLFRGLIEGKDYHPDVAKQMNQLGWYLKGVYTAHYGGNPFYDGYPYGLNRIDEGFIRLSRPVFHAAQHHLFPESQWPVALEGLDLYYWARSLRVLYGMFVVVAAYLIARALSMPRWAAILASLAMAVAPLSVTVSHMATGDIGVDMFTALVFLFMACLVRRERHLLLLTLVGFAAGFAFASKYQGLLVAWVPFVFLFLRDGLLGRKWSRLIAVVLVLSVTFVATVVIANPLFLVHPARTWHELVANLVFISKFGANQHFFEQPLLRRVAISFYHNTPFVLGALGWGTVALAGVGMILCMRQAWRMRSDLADNGSLLLLRLAIFSFPFVAIAVSLATKPEIQPFHFSSLQLPLALSAAFGIATLFDSSLKTLRWGAVLAALVMLTELGHHSLKDNYFWQREDILNIADQMPQSILYFADKPEKQGVIVRKMMLEPVGLSVFRNLPADIKIPAGDAWNALQVPPVPCVPYPLHNYWIFMNGPVFPRNDRMFKVDVNTSVEKSLVFNKKPSGLKLGIRSGFAPTEFTFRSGTQRKTLEMPPDSCEVINLAASDYDCVDMRGEGPSDVYIAPITATALYGDAWVTVLGNELETANFLLFSGKAGVASACKLWDGCPVGKIPALIDDARFLGGNLSLMELSCGESCVVIEDALPAGIYKLELSAMPLSPNTEITVFLKDMFDRQLPVLGDLTNAIPVIGTGTVVAQVEKPFAPYQIRLEVRCVAGACVMGAWRLQPDAKAILGDLKSYTNSASAPAWLGQYAHGSLPSNRDKFGGILFASTIELEDVSFPTTIQAGTNEFLCFMRMNAPILHDIDKYQVFLHFLDANKSLAGASGISLHQAVSAARSGVTHTCLIPADMPAGEYEVWMGIYNIESGTRMKLLPPASLDVSVDAKRRLLIGRTTVLPGGKTGN